MMFPVICLSCQLVEINKYIAKHSLLRKQILIWLNCYGELVIPGQPNTIENWVWIGQLKPDSLPVDMLPYGLISLFGFKNTFRIIGEQNQIKVSRPMGGFRYDKYNKWIET